MSETSEGEISLNFTEKNWERSLRETARPHYELAKKAGHSAYFGIVTNLDTQASRSTKHKLFFSPQDVQIDHKKLAPEVGPRETVTAIAWVRPPVLAQEVAGNPSILEHKEVVSDDKIGPNLQREIQRLSEIPADETVRFWPTEMIIVWEKGISVFYTEDLTTKNADENVDLTPKKFIPWENR